MFKKDVDDEDDAVIDVTDIDASCSRRFGFSILPFVDMDNFMDIDRNKIM